LQLPLLLSLLLPLLLSLLLPLPFLLVIPEGDLLLSLPSLSPLPLGKAGLQPRV
jgi:hypothetical protein